jgi:hypothetical protein
MASNPFKKPKQPEQPDWASLALQEFEQNKEMYGMGLEDMRPDMFVQGGPSVTWSDDLSRVDIAQDPALQGIRDPALAGLRGIIEGNEFGPENIYNLNLPAFGKLKLSPEEQMRTAFTRMKELSAPYDELDRKRKLTEIANAGGLGGDELMTDFERREADAATRQDLMFMNDAWNQAAQAHDIDLTSAQFANAVRGQKFDEKKEKADWLRDYANNRFNLLGSAAGFSAPTTNVPSFGIPGTPGSADLLGAARNQWQSAQEEYAQDVGEYNDMWKNIGQTAMAAGTAGL